MPVQVMSGTVLDTSISAAAPQLHVGGVMAQTPGLVEMWVCHAVSASQLPKHFQCGDARIGTKFHW